jgi:hypothetical protein
MRPEGGLLSWLQLAHTQRTATPVTSALLSKWTMLPSAHGGPALPEGLRERVLT